MDTGNRRSADADCGTLHRADCRSPKLLDYYAGNDQDDLAFKRLDAAARTAEKLPDR